MEVLNVFSFRERQFVLSCKRRESESAVLFSKVLAEILYFEIVTYRQIDPIRHNLLDHRDLLGFNRHRGIMDGKKYTNEAGLTAAFRKSLIDRAFLYVFPATIYVPRRCPTCFLEALDDLLLDAATIGAARTLNDLALQYRLTNKKDLLYEVEDNMRRKEGRLGQIGTKAALRRLKEYEPIHHEMIALVKQL